MRKLPSKSEIRQRAEEKAMERQAITMSVDPLTPTPAELKESGYFREAQHELMRGETTEWEAQQRKYIDEMAREMGLRIVTKREYAQLQKLMSQPRNHKFVKRKIKPSPRLKREVKAILRKPLKIRVRRVPHIRPPVTLGLPILRKPRKPAKKKAKKKKRKKKKTNRVGVTPRRLKPLIKDGKKLFSFPNHVWKVRSPRKQRRKKKVKRKRRRKR